MVSVQKPRSSSPKQPLKKWYPSKTNRNSTDAITKCNDLHHNFTASALNLMNFKFDMFLTVVVWQLGNVMVLQCCPSAAANQTEETSYYGPKLLETNYYCKGSFHSKWTWIVNENRPYLNFFLLFYR